MQWNQIDLFFRKQAFLGSSLLRDVLYNSSKDKSEDKVLERGIVQLV